MKLFYSVECDCGETMEIEETDYIEELDYEKHIHVCPKCHKAVIVRADDTCILLDEEDEDCVPAIGENKDVYEEYPD